MQVAHTAATIVETLFFFFFFFSSPCSPSVQLTSCHIWTNYFSCFLRRWWEGMDVCLSNWEKNTNVIPCKIRPLNETQSETQNMMEKHFNGKTRSTATYWKDTRRAALKAQFTQVSGNSGSPRAPGCHKVGWDSKSTFSNSTFKGNICLFCGHLSICNVGEQTL